MNPPCTRRFPKELKESVARRYLSTKVSYRALSAEIGASTRSIRDWVAEFRGQGTVGRRHKKKPTDQRNPEEKLRLLLHVKGLSDSERGEFLRREGLHDGDLERWEQEALGGLGATSSSANEQRIRELERERSLQDKRLKEAKALLELQKKVHALWADEDDDTTHS